MQDGNQDQSLRALFADAEAKRQKVEADWDRNSAAFEENIISAITTFEECQRVASQVALFSPNETLEDISSGDLQ